jgi:hypothetical protein
MRSIEGKLPDEINRTIDPRLVAASEGYEVSSFRMLVELVAKTAYLNKDYLLFFRGQNTDHANKANKSTFYPTIYRGEYLQQREVNYRFEILAGACRLLVKRFEDAKVTGTAELRRKKMIQWSLLQHYEVCSTPLLDFTQSLRVAASFAQLNNEKDTSFVYAFGMPYLTNRISNNSEHDLVNIRLLSICPPEALRPYFQEGYLAGTEDLENSYDSKSELDFNNRLIAKFRIPNFNQFWGRNFHAIPKNALYPKGDQIEEICSEIRNEVERDLRPGQIGEFLKVWSGIESDLDQRADFGRQHRSTVEAIKRLRNNPQFDDELLSQIDKLRRFRNQVVHPSGEIEQTQVRDYMKLLDEVSAKLERISVNKAIQQAS